MSARRLLLPFLALALAACAAPSAEDDDAVDAVAIPKGDEARGAEGTPEALGILRVANELTRDALLEEAHVGSRAAGGIVAGRPFATLAALDAVPYVGPVTFDKLLATAQARGWVVPACLAVSEGPFHLDVRTVKLTGRITIDHRPPPRGWSSGTLVLATAAGDRVVLGETSAGAYTAIVVPGAYEIYYEHGAGDDVPQNRRARLGAVAVSGSRTLDLDVPEVAVTPRITLDGAPPEPTSAELHLRRGEDDVFLGQIWYQPAPVRVVPGTYDVEYLLDDGRDELAAIPRNRRTTVRTGVELLRDTQLAIDLPTAPVAARITENGAPQAADGKSRVVVAGVSLGETPATLLRGAYDVEHWLLDLPGHHAVVDRVAVAGPTTLSVDARVATLTTRVTLNGATPPGADSGTILLLGGGQPIWLGASSSRSFTSRLIAGQGPYDVLWSHGLPSFTPIEVPQNQEAVLLRGVDIDALPELVVDVPAARVSGRVAPAGERTSDVVTLVAVDQPASRVSFMPAADGSFTTMALPGRYRVLFKTGRPNVTSAPTGEVVTVTAPSTTLDLQLPLRRVASTVTFTGVPAAAAGGWSLSFVSAGEVVTVFGGDGDPAHDEHLLVPGRYELVYAGGGAPGPAPANQRAAVGCLEVR